MIFDEYYDQWLDDLEEYEKRFTGNPNYDDMEEKDEKEIFQDQEPPEI